MLWLWRRLAATAPIRSLAWKPPYAAGAAKRKSKKKKKKKKEKRKEKKERKKERKRERKKERKEHNLINKSWASKAHSDMTL